MRLLKEEFNHWYYPKRDRTIVNYILSDVDYTTEENIRHIFDFIKKQLRSEDLIFDLDVSFHDDEFYENGFTEFENIIKNKSYYIEKIYKDNKCRLALFQMKEEKFTFNFFKNIIKYYSGINIYYNLENIDYNSFFKSYKNKKLRNLHYNYEKVLLADFLILIRRDTSICQSDIDIKMLGQELERK